MFVLFGRMCHKLVSSVELLIYCNDPVSENSSC